MRLEKKVVTRSYIQGLVHRAEVSWLNLIGTGVAEVCGELAALDSSGSRVEGQVLEWGGQA